DITRHNIMRIDPRQRRDKFLALIGVTDDQYFFPETVRCQIVEIEHPPQKQRAQYRQIKVKNLHTIGRQNRRVPRRQKVKKHGGRRREHDASDNLELITCYLQIVHLKHTSEYGDVQAKYDGPIKV